MNNSVFPPVASVSDFQRKYKKLIEQVKRTGGPLFVLKKNKLEAVLLSPQKYEEFERKSREHEEELALQAIADFEKAKKERKLLVGHHADDLFK